MKIKRIICTLLLILTWISKLPASESELFYQADKPGFRHIGVNEGLRQSWVRCIYQDDQGFMWFGTAGGLNRYDGYRITSYDLGNVNVNAIAKKSDDELWICNDLGVFIYNQVKDSICAFEPLKGLSVLSVLQEEDNQRIWFGSNSGLYRYNALTAELTLYSVEDNTGKGLSSNYINVLFRDSSGEIWIGTKNGLNLYIGREDSFNSYRASELPGSLSGNDIMAICEDHESRLWVASSKDGTNLLEKDSQGGISFRKVTEGDNIALLVDSKNILWIGRSSNGGIYQIDLNNYRPGKPAEIVHIEKRTGESGFLSDNSIFCLFEDRLKDVWIGTYGGGVNYFSSRCKQFFAVREDSNDGPAVMNNQVNAILEEDRYLWFGTEGGLDRYDKQFDTSMHFGYDGKDDSSISSNSVYALSKDGRGNLWIGTWTGGLNLFDYKTKRFRRYEPGNEAGSISSENVFAIYEDSKGYLWVGTIGGGLNRYDSKSGNFKHYRHDPDRPESLHTDIVHSIIEDRNGRLLISAYGSLDIYDYEEDDFTHYLLKDCRTGNLEDAFIVSFFMDSHQNIWMATNRGLALFSEGDSISHVFTIQDGLPGNAIKGILEDGNGNLWISTNKGLSKFMNGVDVPQIAEFVNFFEDDGLSADEFKSRSINKSESGYMFFGSSKGYTYFHPDSIFLNQTAPEVVFVEMQLLQIQHEDSPDENYRVKGINSLDEIELKYNRSDFAITYSALNYLNPQRNRYMYKLDGYDPDWINAGNQRTVSYKNLKPGKYTFSVRGSNNDGVWCETPRSLLIIIPVPFWQTWMFRISLVVFLILFTWLIFTLRLRSITREKKKLEILVRNRTLDLEQSNEELKVLLQNLKKTQAQLVQAEKMSSMATLTAGVAHEINNPLNYIAGANLGLHDYFKKYGSQDEEATTLFLDSIQTGIDRASRIVKGLNQFRQNSKKLEDECDIHEILENCLVILQPQFKDVVSVTRAYYDKPLKVNGNAAMLNQAFINVLINSIHAIDKDGEMNIATGIEGRYIAIEISDNGCGIPDEHLKQITDPFFTTKSPGEGTGLGLSITYSIIKEHRGELVFDSEPGKGTTVLIKIPSKT